MKLLRKAWYLIPVTLVVGLLGCTDLPTASDLSHQTSSDNFVALEWREPLAQEVVVQQVIGPAGGVIELLGTGIEVRFPEGAVSESVLIEARALQGSVVAFEFGLPGLIFGAPIEIRIDGEGLAGPWLELLGVYFVGGSTSDLTPLETFPVRDDGGSILFEVPPNQGNELRGYAVASG